MDLKSFREDKLKIKTQSEFAELLGVEQSQVSRWEKSPDNMPYQIIQLILGKTGATFEELTGWSKPILEPINIVNHWETVDFTKKSLLDYILSALNSHGITDDEKERYITGLQNGVLQNLIKPRVTIVGRSDTGKSTIINALLGSEKMPTSWTPTTSIAVYIKHIDDRPSYIEEDVWVFKNQVGEEHLWNDRRLGDEAYCRQWKLAVGDAGILKSFGTRQGENSAKQAGSAVLFVDSPLLTNCDIVDLPGFGTETESDDSITFGVAQRSDVIIYLSQANGFMRIEDITYLKQNISALPVWEQNLVNELNPLANLFIVASQAHTVNSGNREQLKGILNIGCENLLKTLPDEYWTERKISSGYNYDGYGSVELRNRFYTYTTDIPDLCSAFNSALKETLELLPVIIDKRAKAYVETYVASQTPNLQKELRKYQDIVDERYKYIELLKDIKSKEFDRIKYNAARKTEVRNSIEDFKRQSRGEFGDYLSKMVNVDSLTSMMRNRGVSNKKEDVEQFGSYLQSMLQEHCALILSEKSEVLTEQTKDYIQKYQDSLAVTFERYNVDVDFDVTWAFASSLATAGIIAGLAGTLVGTGVFYFGSFSLIMGGVGTAALYSMSLGPIGVAVGLVLATGMGIMKLFGGGWEKKVAKRIVDAFSSERISEKYYAAIAEYWDQTAIAFNTASDGLEVEWQKYIKQLEKTVKEYDANELDCKIKSLQNVSDFFDHIPL